MAEPVRCRGRRRRCRRAPPGARLDRDRRRRSASGTSRTGSPRCGSCSSRCSRGCCSPRAVTTPSGGIAAAVTFLIAAVTDRLDGDIARRRGLVTDLGKIADPIADKALTGTALVGLSLLGELSWWVTVVVLVREVGITLLRFVIIRHGVLPAGRGGKVKTAVQALAILLYLLPLERVGARRRRRRDGMCGGADRRHGCRLPGAGVPAALHERAHPAARGPASRWRRDRGRRRMTAETGAPPGAAGPGDCGEGGGGAADASRRRSPARSR